MLIRIKNEFRLGLVLRWVRVFVIILPGRIWTSSNVLIGGIFWINLLSSTILQPWTKIFCPVNNKLLLILAMLDRGKTTLVMSDDPLFAEVLQSAPLNHSLVDSQAPLFILIHIEKRTTLRTWFFEDSSIYLQVDCNALWQHQNVEEPEQFLIKTRISKKRKELNTVEICHRLGRTTYILPIPLIWRCQVQISR